jgi:hypothetical protein
MSTRFTKTYDITWSTDKVGKNDVSTGAIRKADDTLDSIYVALNALDDDIQGQSTAEDMRFFTAIFLGE